MMKSLRRAALGAGITAITIGAALSNSGCKKSEAAMPGAGGRPPALVNVATAMEREAPVYLDEIGKAVAREMVTVMPQVAGRIDALHFADGADLKKGDLLFTIDARPFQAVLDQAQGQLAKDEAASVNAEHFLKRQQDIFKQGFVSPSDYDTALFNSKATKAAMEADKATIEAARLNVEYCTIRSPIDGRAGARLVDPGNVVKINETPLLVIQRIEPIYADFTVSEQELARVRAAMADHTLKTLVKLPTDTNGGEEGDLTFLDNAVQDASGTIRLRATLPNKDRHFWPGQFVNVRFVLSVNKSVLVPTSAPQLGQQGYYVFVVKEDSTAELHPVVLGQQQGDLIVVEKGVNAGDTVITNGQLLVMPGGPVKVEATPAPAPMPGHAPPAGATTQPAPVAPSTQPSANLSGGRAVRVGGQS
ncbi:MAG TPA: efflux RND transporter periplasmic adaptor subunit [Tepidisphaeraceae bacterium]|jgi:multidrug efflux system membrane fusion protein|nr:efflux RND transporter periplasmic adaptor subunit [Tepidisphaeraceae bacterium]